MEEAYATYTTAVAHDGFSSIPFNMFGKVLKRLFNDRIVKKRRKLDKENNSGRTCLYLELCMRAPQIYSFIKRQLVRDVRLIPEFMPRKLSCLTLFSNTVATVWKLF